MLLGSVFCKKSFRKYDLLQQCKQVLKKLFNGKLHIRALNLSKMEV